MDRRTDGRTDQKWGIIRRSGIYMIANEIIILHLNAGINSRINKRAQNLG